MDESEPTHRVVRGTHRRSSDDAGPADKYEPGDRLAPTERELERFPARFERIEADASEDETDDENSTDENAESDATSDAEADTSETTDETEDAESDSQGDESEPVGPAPDPLTEAWVEAADYNGLRSAAGRFDEVNGNWGEDRLRAELLEQVE